MAESRKIRYHFRTIMRAKHLYHTCIIILCWWFFTQSAIGQSAVITLAFPFGARGTGMGETGVSLADDESVVFWNPAGLGVRNERWHGGSVSNFYERLLPAFNIPDLWHTAFAACYQPRPSDNGPCFDFGGFGFFFNFLNFGENQQYDAYGRLVNTFSSYEYVLALAWGFSFADMGAENLSAGITAKYAHSALAPGIDEYDPNAGIGKTVAFDLGLLYRFNFGMRLGLTFQNMGPSVYYISRDEADPIPFTIRLALGFKREFIISNVRAVRLCAEYSLDREFVYNEPYKQPAPFWEALYKSVNDEPLSQELSEIIHHTGVEVTLFNTGSLRYGIMIDDAGSRRELNFGWGLSWLNHFNFDFSYIHSPNGSEARDRQRRYSFSFYNMFRWSENDKRWWENNN